MFEIIEHIVFEVLETLFPLCIYVGIILIFLSMGPIGLIILVILFGKRGIFNI